MICLFIDDWEAGNEHMLTDMAALHPFTKAYLDSS